MKEETRVPKGRGKGVISHKVTSSKKTATEFNKEKKKQPKEKTVDEDRFEGKFYFFYVRINLV